MTALQDLRLLRSNLFLRFFLFIQMNPLLYAHRCGPPRSD
jgi:hypothetical protein